MRDEVNIKNCLYMQEVLNKQFIKQDFPTLTEDQLCTWINRYVNAYQDEIREVHETELNDIEKLTEELIDILHFVNSIGLLVDRNYAEMNFQQLYDSAEPKSRWDEATRDSTTVKLFKNSQYIRNKTDWKHWTTKPNRFNMIPELITEALILTASSLKTINHSFEDAVSFYHKKLKINFERQNKGYLNDAEVKNVHNLHLKGENYTKSL